MNTSRIYLKQFLEKAARAAGREMYVLDAGAGSGQYEALFDSSYYISTDIHPGPSGNLAFASDLHSIPIAPASFDLIVCSQVLEHVRGPELVLDEFFRILKPGGSLYLSTPFFFEEHEAPNDYYRYTQFGLRYLFEKAGFEIESIDWLEGYYMTLAYQLKTASRVLPLRPSAYGSGITGIILTPLMIPVRFLFAALSALFSKLDQRKKNTAVGYAKNYTVIAKKPGV